MRAILKQQMPAMLAVYVQPAFWTGEDRHSTRCWKSPLAW